MDIYAICVVKNEADIIEPCLKAASEWATKIFFLDNGSTDGTWELVNSLAQDNSKIVAWKQDFQPFYKGIRGEVYREFSKLSKPGDWWCIRLDGDEFYIDDPRNFLSSIPDAYTKVYKKSIDYMLTEEDVEKIDFSKSFNEIRPQFKHVLPKCWSEIRFVRQTEKTTWADGEVLLDEGKIYPKTILVAHYQYRSPAQMQLRLDVRNANKQTAEPTKDGSARWTHIHQQHWKELVKKNYETVLADSKAVFDNLPVANPIRHSFFSNFLLFLKNKLRS